jgi:hypothetical protein
VAEVLASGALRGAVDGAQRAAPHGYREIRETRLSEKIFLGNRAAKVLRETGFRGAPGPVAAARASVAEVLACGAQRGAVDGA